MKTACELDFKALRLKAIQAAIDELNAEAEAIRDSFKAAMVDLEDDELTGTNWKCTWHTVTSSRLDTKALKAGAPEVYEAYLKTTTTSRFVLA